MKTAHAASGAGCQSIPMRQLKRPNHGAFLSQAAGRNASSLNHNINEGNVELYDEF